MFQLLSREVSKVPVQQAQQQQPSSVRQHAAHSTARAELPPCETGGGSTEDPCFG